jgi:hypothetical protein
MSYTKTPATYLTIGAAHVLYAPQGTTLPAYSDLADLVGGTFEGFTLVGDTTSAVELTDTPTWAKATSQQHARTIAKARTAEDTKFKFTLRSATEQRLVDLTSGTVVTVVTEGETATVPMTLETDSGTYSGSTPSIGDVVTGPDGMFAGPTTVTSVVSGVVTFSADALVSGTATITVSAGTSIDTINPAGVGGVIPFVVAIVGPYPAGDGTLTQCLILADNVTYDAAQTLSFDLTKYSEIPVELEVLTSSVLEGDYNIIVPTQL